MLYNDKTCKHIISKTSVAACMLNISLAQVHSFSAAAGKTSVARCNRRLIAVAAQAKEKK